jgi:hypothetical protein
MIAQKKTKILTKTPLSQVFLEQNNTPGSFGVADILNIPLFTGLATSRTSNRSIRPPP